MFSSSSILLLLLYMATIIDFFALLFFHLALCFFGTRMLLMFPPRARGRD